MINEITQEENKNPKHMVGFVPFRLELKNFPEYDNFPYNIAFGGDSNINGVYMSGRVAYFPDFSTFKDEDEQQSMIYFNQYNRYWKVEVVYNKNNKSWEGTKYYQNEWKGQGGGAEWRMAFAHMTMGGLVNGEACFMEELFKK